MPSCRRGADGTIDFVEFEVCFVRGDDWDDDSGEDFEVDLGRL